jgi:hypothetical protein
MDPRPRGAAAPVVEEHPLAVPEAAKAEMTPMFEEIAARQSLTEGTAGAIASLVDFATRVAARIVIGVAPLVAVRKVVSALLCAPGETPFCPTLLFRPTLALPDLDCE